MMHKIVIVIYNLLTGAKHPFVYRTLLFFLFVTPVIILSIINYADLDQDATRSILAERRSLSVLAAATIHENLNNIVNLGISYATRPRVVEYTEKGDWNGALSITVQAMEFFPYFDRIVLFNPDGVIKADMQHAIPSVVGQNRADRDWYIGVKRSWKPYISGVYIRGAEPKIPVVSVVVPIKTMPIKTKAGYSAAKEEQKVIGILQFQIKLDIFNNWINKMNIGHGGIIYVVDQYGRLVYHPKYINERTMTDFSSVGIVTKVLKGIGGSEVNYNPIEKEERLAAYEPVSSYGWGVVITQPIELAFIEKNKRLKSAIITYFVIASLAGAMVSIILYSIAISKQAEEKLQESEAKYRSLFENAIEGIFQTTSEGRFLSANPALAKLIGFGSPQELMEQFTDIGRQHYVNPEDRQAYKNILERDGIIKGFETQLLKKDGNPIWVSISARAVRSDEGTVIYYEGTLEDITSRKRMEEQLHTMSLTDELTDLYNRRGFFTLAQQQMKVAERAKKDMLLFFADLDKMKQINDTLGHQEGDKALNEVATILKEVFRESDIIGRMGGDEFAILAIDTTDETREVLTNRLHNILDNYNKPEGRNYQLSLSIGIAHYDPETPLTLDELMAQADTLMYEEKRGKQN